MANLNGKGPRNEGPMTGRALGNCKEATDRLAEGLGLGRRLGRGPGRGLNQRVGGRGGRGFFRAGNGPNNGPS